MSDDKSGTDVEAAVDVNVQGFDNPVFQDDENDEKKQPEPSTSSHSSHSSSDDEDAEKKDGAAKKEQEAVDLELVSMTPQKNGNGLDMKGKDAVIDITYHDNGDAMPGANSHRKIMG